MAIDTAENKNPCAANLRRAPIGGTAMSKSDNQQNFEYYPFRLTGCSFADFAATFREMEGCEIGKMFVFDVDNPEKAESLNANKAVIEKASADPCVNINVNGSYYGKPISFLFTCGILMATDYETNSDSVKAMIADVCEHLA